jgi:HEAT repeat protein
MIRSMLRTGSMLGLAAAAGLCALPAHGDGGPSLDIIHMLTPIDSVPTKEALTSVLQSPNNEVTVLRDFALDRTLDFGMRLRAVRALPHFCPDPPTPQPTACHQAILAVLNSIDTGTDSPGQKILRRRAAIEALGAARSGLPEDVTLLADFLDDSSRDIRVAAARALRDICDPAAIEPLRRQRDAQNEVPQVVHAIEEALAALQQCGQ